MAPSAVLIQNDPPESDPSLTRVPGFAAASSEESMEIGAEKGPTSQPVNPRDDPRTVRPIHGLRWVLTVTSLYSFAVLYGLDTTIAADIQPAIVKDLGSLQKLAWIGAGFPLGSVAVILPFGYAYGLFEIKRFAVLSIIIFEAGSAVCGAAPTMDVLIVGRVIAGIGGAGMYLAALNFVGVFTTLRERSLYTALIGLTWGFGTILGPVVGGLFAEKATWRWAFYINLVLAAIFLPVFLYLSPTNQPAPNRTIRSKLAEIDWIGIALIAGVFVTFVIGLTFGGSYWPWSSYRLILTLTVCAVLLITFITTQYLAIGTQHPIYPGQFLRSRTLLLLYIGTAASATAMVIGAYFIPLYFQFAHSDNALKAAVRLLPFIVMFIFCVMLNGALLPSLGYYMPFYLVSGVLMTVGGALMQTIGLTTSVSKVYGYSILVGAAAGLTAQSGYAVAQAKVREDELSAAISFMNVAQIGTIVIALAIAGTVFQNEAVSKLTEALAGRGFTLPEIKGAVAGTQSVVFQRGGEEVRQVALEKMVEAMDTVFVLLIPAGAVTLVAALLMRREKLNF